MASKLIVYQNDNGIKLYINITKDNLVESIQGAEIEVVFEGIKTGTKIIKSTHSHHPQDTIEITDAEMGEILVSLYEKDTSEIDVYNPRITTIYANGTKLTQDEITFDGDKMTMQIKQPKVKFLTEEERNP